jgi:hypothetical protein
LALELELALASELASDSGKEKEMISEAEPTKLSE